MINSYFDAYRNVKFTRDEDGVLVVQLHSNGGLLPGFARSSEQDRNPHGGRRGLHARG